MNNNELTLKVFEAYAIPFEALQQEAKQAIEDVKQAINGEANAENERKIKEWIFAYYAFERQGASPYFKWKAIELLNKYWNDGNPQGKNIWEEFKESAKVNKENKPAVNEKNNPLYFKFPRNQRGVVTKYPIWKVDFKELIKGLNNNEEIKNAYKCLVKVRGFGHKIASYILRDLIIFSGSKYGTQVINEERQTYYFLQPLDTWVELVGERLYNPPININNEDLEGTKGIKVDNKRKKFIIKKICDECITSGVNPIRFNQGAWYVGAKVVRCREQLRAILDEANDFNRAKRLVEVGINKDHLDKYFPRAISQREELKQQFLDKIQTINQGLIKEVNYEKNAKS